MTHKRILIISTLVGFFIGFAFLSIGLIHNPQCEFYCEGWIDWEYTFLLLFVTAIGNGILAYIVLIAYDKFKDT